MVTATHSLIDERKVYKVFEVPSKIVIIIWEIEKKIVKLIMTLEASGTG